MLDEKEVRNHCWLHFQFHGDQRMKLFYYYLLLTALFYAGITSLVREHDLVHPFMAAILSATHCLLSYVFYKLDQFRWVRGASLVTEYKVPDARFHTVAYC